MPKIKVSSTKDKNGKIDSVTIVRDFTTKSPQERFSEANKNSFLGYPKI